MRASARPQVLLCAHVVALLDQHGLAPVDAQLAHHGVLCGRAVDEDAVGEHTKQPATGPMHAQRTAVVRIEVVRGPGNLLAGDAQGQQGDTELDEARPIEPRVGGLVVAIRGPVEMNHLEVRQLLQSHRPEKTPSATRTPAASRLALKISA